MSSSTRLPTSVRFHKRRAAKLTVPTRALQVGMPDFLQVGATAWGMWWAETPVRGLDAGQAGVHSVAVLNTLRPAGSWLFPRSARYERAATWSGRLAPLSTGRINAARRVARKAAGLPCFVAAGPTDPENWGLLPAPRPSSSFFQCDLLHTF
jgi:hypothetical protein